MFINVNTDALVSLSNKLEKLGRSGLPLAVRGTLNDAAFHVKTVSMPNSAKDNFVSRSKDFFKANSRYEKADGFNIKTMKSSVGFYENNLRGSDNYAVQDLEEQESGGTIDKKSFIPTVFARSGKSNKGLVRPNARLKQINKIINTNDSVGKNRNEKFVIAAAVAGKGGFVLRDDILFRIDTTVKSNLRSKRANFKATPLYTFKKGRKVHVKSSNFMKEAALVTQKLMDDFYIKNGEKQLKKIWK
jgi:hypothetical protein